MKIIYSEFVESDLREIFEYISDKDEDAAYKTVNDIEKTILRLGQFQQSGGYSKIKELRAKNIRMIPYKKYLIFYKANINIDELQILRIIYGARDYKNLF